MVHLLVLVWLAVGLTALILVEWWRLNKAPLKHNSSCNLIIISAPKRHWHHHFSQPIWNRSCSSVSWSTASGHHSVLNDEMMRCLLKVGEQPLIMAISASNLSLASGFSHICLKSVEVLMDKIMFKLMTSMKYLGEEASLFFLDCRPIVNYPFKTPRQRLFPSNNRLDEMWVNTSYFQIIWRNIQIN